MTLKFCIPQRSCDISPGPIATSLLLVMLHVSSIAEHGLLVAVNYLSSQRAYLLLCISAWLRSHVQMVKLS
jgi:hypothetical protein